MTAVSFKGVPLSDFRSADQLSDFVVSVLTWAGFSHLHEITPCFDRHNRCMVYRQHPKWRVFHWPYEWLPPFDTKDAVFRAYFRKGGER